MRVVDGDELKFKLPSGIVVSGPSNSGKTHFTLKLLENATEMFNPPPISILYCYGEYGKHIAFLEQHGIATHAGFPDEKLLLAQPRPFLVVIDDLMLSIDQKWLETLFTRKVHHQQFCLIFLTQNMFEPKLRVARMNSQYLILLKMPSAALHVRTLASQLFPGKGKEFAEVYNDATRNPYSYLLLDLHPTTDNSLRLRSNILPGEVVTVHTL